MSEILQDNRIIQIPAATPAEFAQITGDLIEEGCLLFNRAGTVYYANGSAERLLGIPRMELIGMTVDRILGLAIGSPDLEPVTGFVPAGVPGEKKRPPVEGGEEEQKHLEFTFHRTPTFTALVIQDIARLRVAEKRTTWLEHEILDLKSTMSMSRELLRNNNEELNRSLREIEGANKELMDMVKLKNEFVANTSHELRTPLGSVIGSLKLILDGLCDDRDEELQYVGSAVESANELLDIINDLLDVSKVEAGELSIEIHEIDPSEVFERLYEDFLPEAERAGIAIEFDESGAEGMTVKCDYKRLLQVLRHLIGNAIKFTEEGSVKVTTLPYPDNPDLAIFSVQDTGVGMDAGFHDQAFEIFAQGDSSSRRPRGGTGLGLAVSRRLIECMGGNIWIVKQAVGRGTTISFTLPSGKSKVEEGPKAPNPQGLNDELFDESF